MTPEEQTEAAPTTEPVTTAPPTTEPAKTFATQATAEGATEAVTEKTVEQPAEQEPAVEAPVIDMKALKLPEGTTLDEATFKTFSTVLTDDKLSPQERAQSLIELHTSALQKATEAPSRVWNEVVEKWTKEVSTDKDLGSGFANKDLGYYSHLQGKNYLPRKDQNHNDTCDRFFQFLRPHFFDLESQNPNLQKKKSERSFPQRLVLKTKDMR